MRISSPRVTAIAMAGLALTAMGAMTAAPAMAAVPAAFGTASGPAADNVALINPTASTELLIHKILGPTTGGINNGTAQTVTGDPLQGVQFDVFKINGVDLTTNAGWTAAMDLAGVVLTPQQIATGKVKGASGVDYTITTVGNVVTDATGTATFGTGGVGLFIVAENLTASTSITNVTTGASVAASSVTPSPAFAVTLPMTQPDNLNSWMYSVNVYPKNQVDSIAKAVLDNRTVTAEQATQGAAAKNAAQYVLTSTAAPVTGDRGAYAVYDKLDTRVSFTGVDSVKVNGTALAATDYKIIVDGAVWDGSTPAPGAAVTVQIDPTKVPNDASVVTTLNVTMDSEGTNGVIPNSAALVPSNTWWATNVGNSAATFDATTGDVPATTNADGTVTPGSDTTGGVVTPVGATISSNLVESKYGDAKVTKTNADGTKNLAGAVFSVYADANADGTCAPSEMVDANNIFSGLTTGADGTVTIKGLQVSTFINGAAASATTNPTDITYCLVETKAPTGYNLNAEPVSFQVTAAGDATPVGVAFKNEESNLTNALPLTGGAGAMGAGLGLTIVGGALVARAAAKRRRDQAEVSA